MKVTSEMVERACIAWMGDPWGKTSEIFKREQRAVVRRALEAALEGGPSPDAGEPKP